MQMVQILRRPARNPLPIGRYVVDQRFPVRSPVELYQSPFPDAGNAAGAAEEEESKAAGRRVPDARVFNFMVNWDDWMWGRSQVASSS